MWIPEGQFTPVKYLRNCRTYSATSSFTYRSQSRLSCMMSQVRGTLWESLSTLWTEQETANPAFGT